RRFFDITSLIAVRVEDSGVFAATHGLLLRLVAEGLIDGLRVDHPDGLADPRGYLDRLATATGGAWVVTEKILTGIEELPRDWRCAGTTGYDALGMAGGLLLDPAGAAPPATSAGIVAAAASAVADRLPPRLRPALFAVAAFALGEAPPGPVRDEFVIRFQQTCGPVMAKGVEDTAFYRWPRLASLNEVGGEPGRFGIEAGEFHVFAARLTRDWPATMTT